MYFEKFNSRVKCYPDGNYISNTSNRPWFMTPETRREKRLYEKQLQEEALEKAQEYSAEAHYEFLRRAYGDELYNSLFLDPESPYYRKRSTPDESLETYSVLLDVIKKAKRLGIPVNGVVQEQPEKKPRKGNIRRAKDMVFDLIYLNQFDWFATFTFNQSKVNGYDPQECMKVVKKWLDNHKQRNGLRYLMIPEYHPTSGRIHMHMLYSGDLKLKQAVNAHTGLDMYTKDGKPIYNCTSWRYGFSTVIPCDGNQAKLAFYVSKYITKDVHKIFGKFYYSSQDLKRDVPVTYGNRDFGSIQAPLVHVDEIGVSFKFESSIKFNSETEANTVAILRELGVMDCEAVQLATA